MGAAEARLFAKEGARVAIGDVLEDEGRKVEAEINEAGGEAIFVHLDVTSESEWQAAIAATVARFGKLDTFIYSLAAPRRQGPEGTWSSVLKPIGEPYSGKTIDLRKHEVTEAHIEPASDEEISDTVKVMGGEDWTDWVRVLQDAELLAEGCRTVAYSYVGPDVTRAIYRFGTIGRAKQDLERTAADLRAHPPRGCAAALALRSAWMSACLSLIRLRRRMSRSISA